MESTLIYMIVSHFWCIARFASLCVMNYIQRSSHVMRETFFLVNSVSCLGVVGTQFQSMIRTQLLYMQMYLSIPGDQEWVHRWTYIAKCGEHDQVVQVGPCFLCQASFCNDFFVFIWSDEKRSTGPNHSDTFCFFFRAVCWRAMKPLAIATIWKMSDEAIG